MSKAIQFKKNGENIYPCPYYPVGSIYLSVNNINPGTIFGGTWEQIKDRFLLGAGNTYGNGSTGGTSTHYHSTGNCTLEYKHLPSEVCVDGNFGYLSGCGKTGVSGWQITSMRDVGWENTKPHNHGNTGSSNNMPPYLVVYIWKRVS